MTLGRAFVAVCAIAVTSCHTDRPRETSPQMTAVEPPAEAPPPATKSSASEAVNFCNACSSRRDAGPIRASELDETSGIAASKLHPGAYYLHNDSGDGPRFFAVDEKGVFLAAFRIQGEAFDWEDMAIGPCADAAESCLYFADIGDNLLVREKHAIYRVHEPKELRSVEAPLPAEKLVVRYPDGAHDAETLLVHPSTGAITLVTKEAAVASTIYEVPLPFTADAEVTAKIAGKVTPLVGSKRYTGGSAEPHGHGVLLRTYSNLWFFSMQPTESIAGALSRPPCAMPVANEPQAEAVGWMETGRGYVTISEGASPTLHEMTCTVPPP